MKILIVEDEPKTGEYLRQGLSEAGYVGPGAPWHRWAAHGLARCLRPVILDVMLPG